jgi:RsiW-degrading membrane proteinase PrsW (M82 family)
MGLKVACTHCGAWIAVPAQPPMGSADAPHGNRSTLEPVAHAVAMPESPRPPSAPPINEPPTSAEAADASAQSIAFDQPRFWRRHLHWLLALALIPLCVTLLTKSEQRSVVDRLVGSLDQVDDEERERIVRRAEKSNSPLDELILSLPDQKLRGAYLQRKSHGHWLIAGLAAVVFFAFCMFLASDGSAYPRHVLLVGLFTAIVGIAFLLIVQALASFTEGKALIGRSVWVAIFYIFKFIAYSYSAAINPENGFILSFLGFTFGVGLCEELVKTIPLFRHRPTDSGPEWRGLLIWGLASGAGFGIAEGLIYAGSVYNGIVGLDIYLVRFLSCVALHAIWSGSVAALIYHRRDLFERITTWYEWILPTLYVIAVLALLHGLYDTCLKKQMHAVALAVAVASFVYLAVLLNRVQAEDARAAQRKLNNETQGEMTAVS